MYLVFTMNEARIATDKVTVTKPISIEGDLYIEVAVPNGWDDVKITFDGNGFGDGHFVGCDSCFVHRGNKIQEESVAVNNFFKFLLTVVDFFRVNLFCDGIQISPKTTNFDRSFHTS